MKEGKGSGSYIKVCVQRWMMRCCRNLCYQTSTFLSFTGLEHSVGPPFLQVLHIHVLRAERRTPCYLSHSMTRASIPPELRLRHLKHTGPAECCPKPCLCLPCFLNPRLMAWLSFAHPLCEATIPTPQNLSLQSTWVPSGPCFPHTPASHLSLLQQALQCYHHCCPG